MVGNFSQFIDQPQRDCIYEIIRHMQPGLCVDIGAAAGHTTRKIFLAGGGDTRVVAYEPFPGNHPYFYQSVKKLDNDKIRLVKKAVSDTVGTSEFIVSSVVQGSESGWQKFAGYSSTGFLSSPFESRSLIIKTQSKLKALLKRPVPQLFRVDTTTVDREFPDLDIDFMKIDVQGAEIKVLRGAKAALAANRIRVLYIEWGGEVEITDILADNGYLLFDSTYIIEAKTRDLKPFSQIGFKCIAERHLSTGKTAFEMILADKNISPLEALREIRRRKLGCAQTDLIAVRANLEERFLRATEQYARERAATS